MDSQVTDDPGRRLVPLVFLLSATAGIIDAVSVLGLGKVFTANMTGNIVFLGLAVARTPGFAIAPSLTALLSFLGGAVIGGRVHKASGPARLRRWAKICAAAEVMLLVAAAFVAFGYSAATLSEGVGRYATIGLLAVAMGLRNATMRQFNAPDLTTTVLTTILTAIASESSLAGGTNANLGRRLLPVVAIFAGAIIGAFLVLHVGVVAPLLLAATLDLIGLVTIVWGGPAQLAPIRPSGDDRP